MRRGLRFSLAVTHMLVAALAVVLLAVAVTVTGERRFERYLSDVREREDAAVVQALESTYRPDVGWDARAIFALSQAARLADVNLAVYSPDGQLAFTVQGMDGLGGDGTAEGASGATASPTASPLRASSFDIRRYPVTMDGRQVATVDVYAAREMRAAAESAYEDALARDLLLAALVAGLLGGVVSLVVSRRITGPLEELADAATDVAGGNLEVRVAPRGEDEVATLATAFNAMADALARDEEWRREMTADLAGELRAPLAAIQARIEALENGVMPPTPDNLRVIGAEVERLGRLLGALRSLNEMESADFELTLVPTDLADLAREALARAEPEAACGQVTMSADLAPTPALADRERLLRAFGDLLDNALKFTPSGGTVTLTAGTAPDGAAFVSFTDTGPGIDPVDLPLAFDRFYRSPGARGTQGVGLGLAIAKALVEAHGGTVEAANGAGGGAVFTVRLPHPG